jgi:uncharacterized membrane protein YeaQ/YmgE (transglycosylase-associated protein family)
VVPRSRPRQFFEERDRKKRNYENVVEIITNTNYEEESLVSHAWLAWIAFIVIGLVIGWWFSRESDKPGMVILLGLVGALVGGLVIYYCFRVNHHTIARYGSIIVSIVVALVLALLSRNANRK